MAAACPDADLVLTVHMLRELMQLPSEWKIADLRVDRSENGQLTLHVDCVFPDGPSRSHPVELLPRYEWLTDSHGATLRDPAGRRALCLEKLDVRALVGVPARRTPV